MAGGFREVLLYTYLPWETHRGWGPDGVDPGAIDARREEGEGLQEASPLQVRTVMGQHKVLHVVAVRVIMDYCNGGMLALC